MTPEAALPVGPPRLFDRSRYSEGLSRCQMARYLRYELQGRGITRRSNSIPLSTGNCTHSALAGVLEACRTNAVLSDGVTPLQTALVAPEPPWALIRPVLRPAVETAVAAYRAEVAASGFLDTAPEEAEYLSQEQSCLAAGLTWGFVRSQLPLLLREFEILEIEREDLLQVGEHRGAVITPIVYMLRPDFLVRRRLNKRLYTFDFKTAYSLEESWQAEWENNLQMATQGLGAEARLGEPIVGYYMLGLLKGSRRSYMIDNGDGGKTKGPRRQSSVWCYGWLNPGNPPIQEPAWEHEYTRKKGFSKAAIWQDYAGGVEQLAFDLPEHILHAQYLMLGPFERNEVTVERWLKEAPAEEGRWIDRLAAIKRGEPVESHIASSWACQGMDGPCAYVPVCYGFPSAELLYEPRTPHHEEELRLFPR